MQLSLTNDIVAEAANTKAIKRAGRTVEGVEPLALGAGIIWAFNHQTEKNYSYRDEQLRDTPAFSFSSRLQFIPWGTDNLYPLQFLDLFTAQTGNAYYEAVKRSWVNMLLGNGLKINGGGEYEQSKIKSAFSQQCLSVWAWDLCVFNAFCSQKIYTAEVKQGMPPEAVLAVRKLEKPVATPVSKVRMGAPMENEYGFFEPAYYFVGADWREVKYSILGGLAGIATIAEGYIPVATLRSDVSIKMKVAAAEYLVKHFKVKSSAGQRKPFTRAENKRQPKTVEEYYASELYYDKQYHIAADYYPKPDAESCLRELKIGALIAQFHEYNLRQGSNLAGVVQIAKRGIKRDQITGELSAEEYAEQAAIATKIKDTFAGTSKAGAIGISFYDPDTGEQPAQYLSPPQNNNDKLFIETQKGMIQAALTGSGAIVPEIHGIITPAGFSNKSDAMKLGLLETERQHIGPLRARLVKHVNDCISEMGFEGVNAEIETSNKTSETPSSRFAEFGVGGAQALIGLATAVKAGQLDQGAAIEQLVFLYGVERAQALKMIGQPAETLTPTTNGTETPNPA